MLARGVDPHKKDVGGPAVGIGLQPPVPALGAAVEKAVAGVHGEAVVGFVAEVILDAPGFRSREPFRR